MSNKQISLIPKECLLIRRLLEERTAQLEIAIKNVDKEGWVNIRKNEIVSMPIENAEKEYYESKRLSYFFDRICRGL